MKNLVDYEKWKITLENINNENEILDTVGRLNFKGYMSAVTGIDEQGNELAVKTRSVNRLSELYHYDFSDCYLYKIEKVTYTHYFTPEGTNAWDYDFTELSQFDSEQRYGYRIRYANNERKVKNNEMV
jgi:hypothetical protein